MPPRPQAPPGGRPPRRRVRNPFLAGPITWRSRLPALSAYDDKIDHALELIQQQRLQLDYFQRLPQDIQTRIEDAQDQDRSLGFVEAHDLVLREVRDARQAEMRAARLHEVLVRYTDVIDLSQRRLDIEIRGWEHRGPNHAAAARMFRMLQDSARRTTSSIVRQSAIFTWLATPPDVHRVIIRLANLYHTYYDIQHQHDSALAGSPDRDQDPLPDRNDDDQWHIPAVGDRGANAFGQELWPSPNGFADFIDPRTDRAGVHRTDYMAMQTARDMLSIRVLRYHTAVHALSHGRGTAHDFLIPNQFDIWLHRAITWVTNSNLPASWGAFQRQLFNRHGECFRRGDYDLDNERVFWMQDTNATLLNNGQVVTQSNTREDGTIRTPQWRINLTAGRHRVRQITFTWPVGDENQE